MHTPDAVHLMHGGLTHASNLAGHFFVVFVLLLVVMVVLVVLVAVV